MCGNSCGSQTTTQTTAPNPQASAAYQSVLGTAASVAATPYTPYGGELVAPVNAQQETGINNINANANYAQPYINQAAGLATSAAAPISAADIASYTNPYTNAVVGATENQFANTNAQAQSALQGNAISQGALGGNRVGVAQGILAGQEQTAQAPVIAGLESSGYQQGVQTAETEQQAAAQGAYSLGNLGVAGENAALTGANAQVGAGTLQQSTQQAQDTAAMNAFYQQEFYPEAITGWEAGLDTGVGSQLGGTSSTTAPPPNPLTQLAGLGTAAAGAFIASDRRLKENIKKIGKLDDGQTIYKFNFKGDRATRIGLMAQDVQKKHPEAVHTINGIKGVDYDEATKDAERRNGGVVGYASGGTPSGVDQYFTGSFSNPYFSMGITPGKGAPQPPQVQPDQSGQNSMNTGVGDLIKGIKSNGGLSNSINMAGYDVASSLGDIPDDPAAFSGLKRGGYVRGYADGGDPTFQDQWASLADTPYAPLTADDVASNSPFVFPQSVQDQLSGDGVALPPLPQPRPDDAPIGSLNGDTLGLDQPWSPTNAAIQADVGVNPGVPSNPPTNTQANPGVPLPQPRQDNAPTQANPGVVSPSPDQTTQGVVNPTVDADAESARKSRLGMALMSAGFGMLASKSPFFGVGIGEGGQAGISAYTQLPKIDAETRKLDAEAKKASIDVQNEQYMLEMRKNLPNQPFMQSSPTVVPQGTQSPQATQPPQGANVSALAPRVAQVQQTPSGPVAVDNSGQPLFNLAKEYENAKAMQAYGAAAGIPAIATAGTQNMHLIETMLNKGQQLTTSGGVMPVSGSAETDARAASLKSAGEAAARAGYETVEVQPQAGGPTYLARKSDVLNGNLPQGDSPVNPGVGSPPGARPGSGLTVAKQPEIYAKQQEAITKDAETMNQQYQARQIAKERLGEIADLMKTYQSGSFAQEKAELIAKARAIGLPISNTDTANPAAFEQFMKNATANVFDNVKQMGGRVLVSEIQGLTKANANPEMQPEANRAILGQGIGLINYEDKYYNDFTNWYQQHPTALAVEKAQFDQQWQKSNPLHPFVQAGQVGIQALGATPPMVNSKDPNLKTIWDAVPKGGKIVDENGKVWVKQ